MKIKTIDELLDLFPFNRDMCSTKIVLCHGVFDILHVGHIKHFQAAKKYGDILIVSITSDQYVNKGDGRPIFNQNLRAEAISALSFVDFVYINDFRTSCELIKKIKPDYYAKGIEYKTHITRNLLDEQEMAISVGCRNIYTDEDTYSSTNILNKIQMPSRTFDFIQKFKKTHTVIDFKKYFDAISKLNVLVIGEAIIDEYYYGNSLGKSGKGPIVAFQLEHLERYAGGSLAIANHLSEFVNVHLITTFNPNGNGTKIFESDISSNIEKNIDCELHSTIVKRRYIENDQKLFETYNMNVASTDSSLEKIIVERLEREIENYDLVLVADFGHGLFTKKLRDYIKNKAKFLAVNTQLNAGNKGHNTIRKYWDRKTNIFISIDEMELRLAVCDEYENSHSIQSILANTFGDMNTVAITRGHHGCILQTENETQIEIPAFTNGIVDTVGAGDAFFALSSLCAVKPFHSEWIGFVGNVAGALGTSYVANKEHITKRKLYRFVETILK